VKARPPGLIHPWRGAADGLDTLLGGAETSAQTLLTTPQHA